MDDAARADIEATAREASWYIHKRTVECCGATPPGYDVGIYCEREPGHEGRHWSDRINWPAA